MGSEVIKQIMKAKGYKGQYLADRLGIKHQTWRNKLTRDTWTVEEFVQVLEFMNCSFVIRDLDDDPSDK